MGEKSINLKYVEKNRTMVCRFSIFDFDCPLCKYYSSDMHHIFDFVEDLLFGLALVHNKRSFNQHIVTHSCIWLCEFSSCFHFFRVLWFCTIFNFSYTLVGGQLYKGQQIYFYWVSSKNHFTFTVFSVPSRFFLFSISRVKPIFQWTKLEKFLQYAHYTGVYVYVRGSTSVKSCVLSRLGLCSSCQSEILKIAEGKVLETESGRTIQDQELMWIKRQIGHTWNDWARDRYLFVDSVFERYLKTNLIKWVPR